MDRIPFLFLLAVIPLAVHLQTSLAIHTTGGLKGAQFANLLSTTADRDPDASTNLPAAALIEMACGATIYKDFCITTLNSKPETQSLDLKGLAFLTMKLAREHANDTAAFIASMLKDQNTLPSALEDALEECNDQYDDALAMIGDSIEAFLANAANDVNTWMSTAITNADTCQQNLNHSGVTGAMGDRNEVLQKLCGSALAATSAFFQH